MSALPCELSVVRPEDAEDPAVLMLREARCLFAQVPTWTEFYRTLLGNRGLVAELFTDEEREAFEHSLAYAEILRMLGDLRRQSRSVDCEPCLVITVRLPKCLHESLRREAHRYRTSMNQLAVAKFLAAIDPALVPTDL